MLEVGGWGQGVEAERRGTTHEAEAGAFFGAFRPKERAKPPVYTTEGLASTGLREVPRC